MVVKINIVHGNSFEVLKNYKNIEDSVITSPPDISELNIYKINDYLFFLKKTAELIMSKIKDNGFIIIIFTDRYWEEDGNISFIDKKSVFINEAKNHNMELLFIKILKNNNDKKGKTRYLNYSNILCFRKNNKNMKMIPKLENDILYPKNEKIWIKGFYYDIIELLILFLKKNGVKHITDMFSGVGTTALISKKHNISSLIIEINEKLHQESKKMLQNKTSSKNIYNKKS